MGSENKINISYAGSLDFYKPQPKRVGDCFKSLLGTYQIKNINSHTRSCYFLFKGVKRFIQKFPGKKHELEINFWGLIDTRNIKLAEEMGLSEVVKFFEYMPKHLSLQKLASADLLFLPLEVAKDGQKSFCIPGKCYDYLQLEKPVFVLGDTSDCTEILLKSGLGFVVDPFNEELIADKLFFLIENRTKLKELFIPNADFIEKFNSLRQTAQLANIFNDLLASH
jgi:glycosyltransferase involved in cell wall biosynthesis